MYDLNHGKLFMVMGWAYATYVTCGKMLLELFLDFLNFFLICANVAIYLVLIALLFFGNENISHLRETLKK